jgi:hypothetical protein
LFVPVIVPFSPSLTLLVQAYHFTSWSLSFYCFSLSLFLTFHSLSSSIVLVLFFCSLNIGHSVYHLDCGTVLSQGVCT